MMRRHSAVGLAVMLLLAPEVRGEPPVAPVELTVRSGVDEDGGATDDWLSILRKRLSPEEYEAVAEIQRPITDDERRWGQLIRSRLLDWSARTRAVTRLYDPAPPPSRVVIVLGNRGASDGFTHDPTTMGFDLSELQRAYGSASSPENTDRIDRLFTHEYAHLMQKSWMRSHPHDARTPLASALRGIWLEGLGHYHSMSDGWRATEGQASEKATAMLATLEPRFSARLAALACADDVNVARLTADLSQGRFDRKWGALTSALWLEEEMSGDPEAYRRLVEAGPEGILALAARHLPDDLAAVVREGLANEQICHP